MPTPGSAARLAAGRLETRCERRSHSGGRTGAVLIERARSALAFRLGEPVARRLILMRVQLVQGIRTTVRAVEKAITKMVETHPCTPPFASVPCIGKVNLAQIIGDTGPFLERAQSCEQLIAETGVVSVTRASGKSRSVGFRFAANRGACLAVVPFADNSRHSSDGVARVYNDARNRKKRRPRATHVLSRS